MPVKRLDDVAEMAEIDRVDFIKIDVEGFERNVLQGGAGLIARTRPKVIILEENNPDPETGLSPTLEMVRDMGYDLFQLPRTLWSVRLCSVSSRTFCHDYAPAALRKSLRIDGL